ncbi:hypothetical protein [Phytohabitans suffuscus]|uniref:Uncharacterized protein n=1 Tax=Phytohabitans suffuscus TaxID=624315 RepID=A0A6F8YD87_9ACTN|nr:hypothetical protein [Phytohabitans suffuscus]BCB83921.1 hypothetical protein Psuf_012340 [Phytohabitans suffuscus]
MSKHPFAAVQHAFPNEVESAFRFLVDDFGLEGPEVGGVALPTIAFVGRGLRYRIMLDPDDMAVITRVEVETESKRLVAELDNLVQAAGLGAPNHVKYSARTLTALRKALESQAKYVRLLRPRLVSDTVLQLMQMANAREWTVR